MTWALWLGARPRHALHRRAITLGRVFSNHGYWASAVRGGDALGVRRRGRPRRGALERVDADELRYVSDLEVRAFDSRCDGGVSVEWPYVMMAVARRRVRCTIWVWGREA